MKNVSLAALLALAALSQGCLGATETADSSSSPAPSCVLQPRQPYDVPQWAVYHCPNGDTLPQDEAQCARLRDSTGDCAMPALWVCDRPGTGSVILAAISEANDPAPASR